MQRCVVASMRLPRALRRRCARLVIAAAIVVYILCETTLILQCLRPPPTGPVARQPGRVYIAALHWNSEQILRSRWNPAVVALARALGPESVFVAVYESGSWDDSKGALRELDAALDELGVRRNITLSDVTHEDEMSATRPGPGWVSTPRGRTELRRIPYLARRRNWALEPLQALARQGERFDAVLFLNDVVFTTDDVLRLLGTNGGDYAAACSLDYNEPPRVYDTFALRDAEGHEMLTQTWPYFRAAASRQAIMASRPTPVTSCWNGMVAMPAGPFVAHSPLRFRGIADSLAAWHLEGSECCLIHTDNPLRHEKRTFVNPSVRVAYSADAYDVVHSQQSLLSFEQVLRALWGSRVRRWVTSPWLARWKVRSRVGSWRRLSGRDEDAGETCIVDEMQVLEEKGWAHV